MKSVLVTGGCGYIGSHVARAFKQAGYNVIVVDQVRRDHTLVGIDYSLVDDFSSDDCLKFIREIAPDIIVHCAGTSLVGPSVQNPAPYWDTNVVKTARLMNAITDLPKTPLFLFSSSASVYGMPQTSPIPETHPIAPISPYGDTKAAAEKLLENYSTAYGIPTISFRFFNAAGSIPDTSDLGQEPGATHVIARTLEAAINQTKFTLYGDNYPTHDGTPVRDYVHVWDVALAHVLAASALLPDTFTPINLGSGRGFSVMEIIDAVTEQAGKFEVTVGQPRTGDPAVLVADISLAQQLLGWQPQHSDLSTIIHTAHQWYNK